MTEAFVFGQPYWGRRIAEAINASGSTLVASFMPEASYLRALIPAASDREGLLLIRAGYRLGATTTRGRLFDAYWRALTSMRRRARSCHYWLGSDVLDTLAEAQARTLRLSAIRASRRDLHLADAPWLAAELHSIGIDAQSMPVPPAHDPPAIAPPLPARFAVLSYLPGQRFAFYGGDILFEVASRMPDVRFDVVGRTDAVTRVPPPNVVLHGWVADMRPRYADASVVVRIPAHDGLGSTVVEGLLNARHVIYTQQLPYTTYLAERSPAALFDALAELQAAHSAGRLGPNTAGREYALEAFDRARLSARLAALLVGEQ